MRCIDRQMRILLTKPIRGIFVKLPLDQVSAPAE
jgi:hypothetical protein